MLADSCPFTEPTERILPEKPPKGRNILFSLISILNSRYTLNQKSTHGSGLFSQNGSLFSESSPAVSEVLFQKFHKVSEKGRCLYAGTFIWTESSA